MTNDGVIILPNGRPIVKAIYTKQPDELPEYIGNPLIEALPPILPKNDVYKYLTPRFAYNEKDRNAQSTIRLHCVYRLFNYFQPFEKHYDLEHKISTSIRRGYIDRNPCDPSYAERIQKSYAALKKGVIDSGIIDFPQSHALGFTFLGISGIGKTTSLNRILNAYQQAIGHSNYEGLRQNLVQLTWLKVDCSHDGSIKGIGENLFEQVDELLGTTYYSQYASSDYKARRLIPAIRHVAITHCLGLLIVDEIQNLSHLKSGGAQKMLQFFVQLRNEVGVPVILVGTPSAKSILQSTFATARRGCSQGYVSWRRLPFNDDWTLFVEGMWSYQWTKKSTELTSALSEKLYYESQGILDVAVKLYALAQCKVIVSGEDEDITAELIEDVAKVSLEPLQPMLKDLRDGNETAIDKYGDIEIDFDEKFEYYMSLAQNISEEAVSVNQEHALIAQIVSRLSLVGIASSKAYPSVLEALDRLGHSNIDVDVITQLAAKISMGLSTNDLPGQTKISKRTSNKNKLKAIYETGDLRLIGQEAKKAKEPTYNYIKKYGYIKDPVSEFITGAGDSIGGTVPNTVSG